MAVVSISRIQVRRGQKTTGTGLPQLASGELGWAIDTQELFIGNGAVSEGAPQVGNTKLLTEHDNLFQLADTYSYDADTGVVQTGTNPLNPLQRTLQDRLDDRVSVKAFGCKGDGSDCTEELQQAIDQLFVNTATKGNPSSRVVLHMESGEYLISDTIYIPPYVTIQGAGSEKTIIKQTEQVPVFQTVNETSTPGTPASDSNSTFLNQARHISISGITLDISDAPGTHAVIVLQSCRDSHFEDIKILGSYLLSESNIDNFNIAFKLNSLSSAVTCQNNLFHNIVVQNTSYGFESKFDITKNTISNSRFETVGYGVVFGKDISIGVVGQLVGPTHNVIRDCVFQSVSRHAFWINAGQYNTSRNNKYFSVGNDDGTSANATYSVVVFNDEYNHSDNDYFERANDLSVDQSFTTVPFVPLIEGKSFFDYDFALKAQLSELPQPATVFRLPGLSTGSYTLDYWYDSSAYSIVRSGSINIVLNIETGEVVVSDDYEYSGPSGFSRSLSFTALLSDEDSDSAVDTLLIQAKNTLASDIADVHFKITAKA